MAKRTLVAVREDAHGKVHHYWSDGSVVVWVGPHRWDFWRIPEPEAFDAVREPNYEAAPEVHADD